MRIMIESTGTMTELDGVPVRYWEGKGASECYICRGCEGGPIPRLKNAAPLKRSVAEAAE